jgi:hypothetical protein
LKKALAKKPVDLIRLGDYQPTETKYRYSRKMLEVCRDLNFPVLILEKTPSLIGDMELLKEISRNSYLNIGWSIITARDDELRKHIERVAPPVKARFAAMRKVAEQGILTGTVFMPMLPFIYDDAENIEAVVAHTKENGGKYVLDGGLSLYGSSQEHFLGVLGKVRPDLIEKYRELYSSPMALKKRVTESHKLVRKYCEQYGLDFFIRRPVAHFPSSIQVNKRLAGTLYLRARELQLSGGNSYKEWAYRKAAWATDELETSLEEIWASQGMLGLRHIEGIGRSIGAELDSYFRGGKNVEVKVAN